MMSVATGRLVLNSQARDVRSSFFGRCSDMRNNHALSKRLIVSGRGFENRSRGPVGGRLPQMSLIQDTIRVPSS